MELICSKEGEWTRVAGTEERESEAKALEEISLLLDLKLVFDRNRLTGRRD